MTINIQCLVAARKPADTIIIRLSQPTKENCQTAAMTTDPVKIPKNNLQEIITEVSYFCYKTDQGHLGRLLVDGAEEDQSVLQTFYYTDVPQISFSYDTWE